LNIELLTLTEVTSVSGDPGHFSVNLHQYPRYVDTDKCIACGECARKCPKKVKDEFNEELNERKAIYVKYAQAVPLKYQIDPQTCIKLLKGKCGACEKVCPADAVNFSETAKDLTVDVGSIILAPGFRRFDPTGISTWGYKVFPNVITALEMERYLSASGPTTGHLIRPSDGREVKKLAFLQCVGSRDYNKCSHGYCSSACCMFSIKEAMMAMEHVKGLEASIFYMDVRTHGKEFERYYQRAQQMGIKFHRCRVHSLEPAAEDGDIYFRYITDEGKQVEDSFDMVVLSMGMETPPQVVELAGRVGVNLNENLFAETSSFTPVNTNRPGIYTCGTFTGPKDIPQAVMEASAAAAAASAPLAEVRGTLARSKEFPPEREVLGEEPRIGVFICHCGTNIAGVIDVAAVAEYAASLPRVAYVERNLFTCAQDTQNIIREKIQHHGLNRIVVAACSPRTHEALFQETLKASGLNEYLFEMANIRNQGSWVHADDPAAATDKAKDMVRMAVAKVGLLEPLPSTSVPVNRQALVVGGGLVGMTAALGLADQGFPVVLVEKSKMLGGNARHLFETWKNEAVPAFVDDLVRRVQTHPEITVALDSGVIQAEGFVGNFRSTVLGPKGPTTVDHGATILAVGGKAYKPDEYLYGHSRRVLTALEFDKLHQVGDERVANGRNFVFIQCVGSREGDHMYCSRVCCTHSVQAAITLKEQDPERRVFILYRDVRTYGQREALYKKARELGVIFIKYKLNEKPVVRSNHERLEVTVTDHVLHEPFTISADVVVLAAAIVPHRETQKLAQLYKVPMDGDGFLQEAHAKLRPVDFASDGLFLAGLAHYPKPLEESLAQAQAAVARAVTVLSRPEIRLDAIKARVVEANCDGCALCLDVCPYHAIALQEVPESGGKRRVAVNVAQCKGCGTCMATCPKEGVNVGGFSYQQVVSQVRAALT
jgi:heterodisulfide reductase subunit A2